MWVARGKDEVENMYKVLTFLKTFQVFRKGNQCGSDSGIKTWGEWLVFKRAWYKNGSSSVRFWNPKYWSLYGVVKKRKFCEG
jgi:hypothetical protein